MKLDGRQQVIAGGPVVRRWWRALSRGSQRELLYSWSRDEARDAATDAGRALARELRRFEGWGSHKGELCHEHWGEINGELSHRAGDWSWGEWDLYGYRISHARLIGKPASYGYYSQFGYNILTTIFDAWHNIELD